MPTRSPTGPPMPVMQEEAVCVPRCGKRHLWLGGVQGLSLAGSGGCSALVSAGDQKTVAQVAPYSHRLWPTACTWIHTASAEGGPRMQGHHPRGLARQAGRQAPGHSTWRTHEPGHQAGIPTPSLAQRGRVSCGALSNRGRMEASEPLRCAAQRSTTEEGHQLAISMT